jgi:hypothetical protein
MDSPLREDEIYVPSLHEIEKTVATLWLNKEARDWLLSNRKKPMPDCLNDAPLEVLQSVDRKGVSLYGGLINYGHHDVMESIYPYCCQLLGTKWSSVVDDYLLRFPPDHHNFNRLCCKLSEYLELYGSAYLKRYPFLIELADYEWIELEKLEQDTDIPVYAHEPLSTPEQIATLHPVRNPTLTIRDYRYNVIEISEILDEDEKLPRTVKPERTLVAIYRHPSSHRCRFYEVGDATAQILDLMQNKITYQSLIPIVVSLTPELAPQEAVSQFLDLIEELQEMGILVGSVA